MASLDKLLDLFNCDSEQAWSEAVFDIARENGFENMLYGVVGSKKEAFENAFLKSNYPAAWREAYDRAQLAYVDPVVAHCLRSTLPIVWTEHSARQPAQQEFYEMAGSFGLRSGISYPIHGASGEFGILSFASDELERADYGGHYQSWLALIRDYVHESSLKFLRGAATEAADGAPTRLTPRELECIKWVMAGKSSWEISQILKCSEATINFHVANLKKKFKVQTRQQAVVKAIKERLIVPA